MKIAIGSDHAGFQYKELIREYLEGQGHDVMDFGTFSDKPVDYPQFIRPVAISVAKGEHERGIVFGGSGNGEAMVANRVRGIRCSLCWNKDSAVLARKHNDANMISLGERMISSEDALEIVRLWLETPFEGGRHIKRIRMIDDPASPEGYAVAGRTEDIGQVSETGVKVSDDFNVLVSFGYILYSEGKKQIEFKVDPGLKGPTVIHIPSPETWQKEMPEWTMNRRDEILDRLKSKCKHLIYKFENF